VCVAGVPATPLCQTPTRCWRSRLAANLKAPKARHIPRKPGALPQACNEIAPLALTRDRRHWFGVEKEKAPGGVTPLGADSPGANCLRCYFTANLNSM